MSALHQTKRRKKNEVSVNYARKPFLSGFFYVLVTLYAVLCWIVVEIRRKGNRYKMSASDLQAKCAPVMESILQSAMAETTKLFQAMIDELMLEVSGLKKENDDLKAKCSKFEYEQKVTAGNKACGKRHRAVQCGE